MHLNFSRIFQAAVSTNVYFGGLSYCSMSTSLRLDVQLNFSRILQAAVPTNICLVCLHLDHQGTQWIYLTLSFITILQYEDIPTA
jgi:hypothetical protein